MTKFPKKYKYNNKKTIKNNIKNRDNEISSPLFPVDQKLHPGCIFSLYLQDTYANIYSLLKSSTKLDINFGLSSFFYSKLNNSSINLSDIESENLRLLNRNQKFLDKLGFNKAYNGKNFLYSEEFSRYLRDVFVNLYKKNTISIQQETINRSKNFQTNLFKNNIEVKEKEVTEYVIKYFIDSKGNALTVFTTSLETIFADVALAVNPQDKRYKKLIGQNVIIPIINKIIPVIGDENIDSFNGSGVMRVTPGHNQYGLELAQKHNLPTEVYAIDISGNFTKEAGEFSGKSVKSFFKNIEKYIDDIGNLDTKNKKKIKQYFDIRTGEKLDPITLNQWNINYDYALDYFSESIEKGEFKIIPASKKHNIIKNLNTKKSINISTKSLKGLLVPILKGSGGEIKPINDNILIERYRISNSKDHILPTLIILNLLLDNHLCNGFSVDDLIDALFVLDFKGEKTRLEKYLDMYELESKDNKYFKKGLKDIKKLLGKIRKDPENISTINNILNDSFAIKTDNKKIYIDFNKIFESKNKLYLQNTDSFNKSFIDSVWFIYNHNLGYNEVGYDKINNLGKKFFSALDEDDFILNTTLLSLEYSKSIIYSDFIFHPILTHNDKKVSNSNGKFITKNFYENFLIYGPDVSRLALLLGDIKEDKIFLDDIEHKKYHDILNKIWNASRFLYKNYIQDDKNLNIDYIIQNISTDITDYDNWILHETKSLLDEFDYKFSENKILDSLKKLLSFFNNILCEEYIESIKIIQNKNTPYVAIFTFSIAFKLLESYIPLFVNNIESKFSVDLSNYDIFSFKKFELKEKNYKVNLLMDIVESFRKMKLKLGIKKHQSIDVFIQSNPDFESFLSENIEVLKSLININCINNINFHENIPVGYELDKVINIQLGIKPIQEQNESKKDIISDLEQKRDFKLERLQHIKSLIVSVSDIENKDIIEQKRKDIKLLQSEIEDIDFEISRLKSK